MRFLRPVVPALWLASLACSDGAPDARSPRGVSQAALVALCTPGAPCADDGNVCTSDVCDAAGLCVHAPANAGVPCRDSQGSCDVAEACTGESADCPFDAFLPATEVCRERSGDCDAAELCTGVSPLCPEDAKLTSLCRPPVGPCDVPESCDGVNNECPLDGFLPQSAVCRDRSGDCDVAELCTGIGAECPGDAKDLSLCRGAFGECDVPEFCDGVNDSCPADAFVPHGTLCRGATGACDPSEVCDGLTASCPVDVFASCTLCGSKYYDANANAELDPEEPPLAQWRMTLSSAGISNNAFTDSSGRYAFTGLSEGDYLVCEATPLETGWVQTGPESVCYSVHTPSAEGEACLLDFGNVCTGAGGGHTIGFWSNKHGRSAFLTREADLLQRLRDLNLVTERGLPFEPTSYAEVKSWLDARAVNLAHMLSAQLAAMELSVGLGFVDPTGVTLAPGAACADSLGFCTVTALSAEANDELGRHPTTFPGSSYRPYQSALEHALAQANTNVGFQSPTPCAFSFAP